MRSCEPSEATRRWLAGPSRWAALWAVVLVMVLISLLESMSQFGPASLRSSMPNVAFGPVTVAKSTYDYLADAWRVDDADDVLPTFGSSGGGTKCDPTSSSEPCTGVSEADMQDPGDRAIFNAILPRTSRYPYNYSLVHPGKYFMYDPSGGFANQLLSVATAMIFTRYANRTLLVPFAGAHSSGWEAFRNLDDSQLFPMDRMLDFEHLAKYYTGYTRPAVLPLNDSLPVFSRLAMKSVPSAAFHGYEIPTFEFKVPAVYKAIKVTSRDASFIYFHGAGFYHHWYSPAALVEPRKYIRAAPSMRKLAMEIVRGTFGGVATFNAIHVRLGDYTFRAGSGYDWYRKLTKYNFNPEVPLYIATDAMGAVRTKWFEPIVRRFNVTYRDGLLPRDAVKRFEKSFPKSSRADFFGMIEQLVCVQAKRYLPSSYSTFSKNIRFMRDHVEYTFPEVEKLFPVKDRVKEAEEEEEDEEEEDGGENQA